MKTFFTSDHHFNHKNIIKYCSRPYEDIEEMNESLIENWNKVVGQGDLVIHIGDLGFFKNKQHMFDTVAKLNGRKWLIMGNHDNFRIADYYEAGFEFVSDKPVIYNEFFILSHKPIFITENMPYVNIYGHVHDNPMHKDRTENTWCVCVERTNYTPVELMPEDFVVPQDTIEKAIEERKKQLDQVIYIGNFRGNRIHVEFISGRVFIKVSDEYDFFRFKQEYSTIKTDFKQITNKIDKILNDFNHPLTIGILNKIF
jgi:calcineurin-like phosphoesterase family protein